MLIPANSLKTSSKEQEGYMMYNVIIDHCLFIEDQLVKMFALSLPDLANPRIIGPSLEAVIRPFVIYFTFGIDFSAGIM
jgi:hypothetical protein